MNPALKSSILDDWEILLSIVLVVTAFAVIAIDARLASGALLVAMVGQFFLVLHRFIRATT